jgi:chaperonin GroEL
MLEDIAVLTGGKSFNSASDDISKITIDDLGKAKKVVVTKEKTSIIEGAGTKDKINERVSLIEKQVEEAKEVFEKNVLTQRIAKLQGGMANMKVGANSEVELKEKMDRVEDALNAAKAALEDGIVIGGGMALFRIAQKLLSEKKIDQMMYEVLVTPLHTIIENSGDSAEEVMSTIDDKSESLGISKDNVGYDAKSNTFADLKSAGVVDPVKVTKEALKAASSVAGTLLTTNCTINEIDENLLNPTLTV